ncbi:MAG: ABC transporter ATP-binding protein, partial [Actinobacteria bacterium]
MLLVREISIEAGARTLITGATFSVQAGDKVGLVGPNGAGKTTLLRSLSGAVGPAGGTIQRSGRIGYLSQEAAVAKLPDEETTALERILSARDIGDLERRIEATRKTMERAEGVERDRVIARFSRLEDEFTARGGYVAKAEAKRFAHSLGISSSELEQRVATMSGGQRRRVEL